MTLSSDCETFTKEKSDKVDQVLKHLHKQGKKEKLVTDASMDSKNTPVFEQGNMEC